MRYGGPILDLVTQVRELISYVKPIQITSDIVDGVGVHLIDKYDWLDLLVNDFQSQDYKNNPDHVRAMAWTNKAVNWINQYCRFKIHGKDAAQFVPGERLIAIKPVMETGGTEIILTTSSECTIYECQQRDFLGWLAWEIWAISDTGRNVKFFCLDASQEQRLTDELEAIRNKAFQHERGSRESKDCWKKFYGLKQRFAPMGYAYASTVHKAQGSTFNHAYVTSGDILKNPKAKERNQLLYVGMSRAAKNLYICE
jgi:hypothetical protein